MSSAGPQQFEIIRPRPLQPARHVRYDRSTIEPKSDNGVFDPVTPPSLRGAKHLAPYGHDGRFAALRDFVRNVIVNEFAGAEPSNEILDALVAYIEDISFLPNPKLGPDGRLASAASAAARRGEALFNKPFRHDAAMSCASCHQPSTGFVDHKVHDVGTGGAFKTSTLINADFSAPYFHDGRYDTYEQVIEHFDRHFDLGLTADDKYDVVAFLDAVGDAAEPTSRTSVQAELGEMGIWQACSTQRFRCTIRKSCARRRRGRQRMA